jgi:hypothetical protein
MARGSRSRCQMLAVLACLAVLAAGCVARRLGPVPSEAPIGTPSSQVFVLGSGETRVNVSHPIHRRFVFPLQPSATYPSPPIRLELAYGDAATGEGMDLEVPPARGPIPTSSDAILTLALRFPGTGLLHLTSMDGECSVTLSRVTAEVVMGTFVCRGLHEDVGPGVSVSASGTFDARV